MISAVKPDEPESNFQQRDNAVRSSANSRSASLRHAVPAVHGSYPHNTANVAQSTRNDGDVAFSLRRTLRSQVHALLEFYNFPAEHRKHLRTTNPIESTFATARHRMIRSEGCLSNKTALAMVFKLV